MFWFRFAVALIVAPVLIWGAALTWLAHSVLAMFGG